MKKFLKREKGITLMVLVVTIIILLILATVTVKLALDDKGVLSEAREAVNEWDRVSADEENQLSKLANDMKKLRNETIGNGSSGEESGGNEGNEEGDFKDKVKPGDYVSYVSPEASFSMESDKTGYSKVQSFNTKDYTGLWQVLYNDEENGQQIISESSVSGEIFILGEKEGYNNLVEVLNEFCSYFADPKIRNTVDV